MDLMIEGITPSEINQTEKDKYVESFFKKVSHRNGVLKVVVGGWQGLGNIGRS